MPEGSEDFLTMWKPCFIVRIGDSGAWACTNKTRQDQTRRDKTAFHFECEFCCGCVNERNRIFWHDRLASGDRKTREASETRERERTLRALCVSAAPQESQRQRQPSQHPQTRACQLCACSRLSKATARPRPRPRSSFSSARSRPSPRRARGRL